MSEEHRKLLRDAVATVFTGHIGSMEDYPCELSTFASLSDGLKSSLKKWVMSWDCAATQIFSSIVAVCKKVQQQIQTLRSNALALYLSQTAGKNIQLLNCSSKGRNFWVPGLWRTCDSQWLSTWFRKLRRLDTDGSSSNLGTLRNVGCGWRDVGVILLYFVMFHIVSPYPLILHHILSYFVLFYLFFNHILSCFVLFHLILPYFFLIAVGFM